LAADAEPTDLLGLPGKLLEQGDGVLAGVGIELPPPVLQGFLLVPVLLALYVALRPLRAAWPRVADSGPHPSETPASRRPAPARRQPAGGLPRTRASTTASRRRMSSGLVR
jgi:hypothetical protein